MSQACTIDGCGKPHKAKGLCNRHYGRLLKYGDPLAGGTPVGEPEKFYQSIVLHYDGEECLIWPYARAGTGYAQLDRSGKRENVHRRLCEEVNGEPPTPEHVAAHSCGKGNLGCVTKGHLSWKTKADNQADRITHGTSNRGERCGAAKLTETQVHEIISLNGKASQTAIAARFGVARTTIASILQGRRWAWLSTEASK